MITYLLVILAAGIGAEPREATFCDFWPLAVGNNWATTFYGDLLDNHLVISVVGQKTYNSFTGWKVEYNWDQISINDEYWVIAGDWLYRTVNEADLDALPITAGLDRWYPAVFKEGEVVGYGLVAGLKVYFIDDDTIGFGHYPVPPILIRGQGPDFYQPGGKFLNYGVSHTTATIVGTCSTGCQEQISLAQRGQDVTLSVPEEAGASYQWYRYGVSIPDATASVYHKTVTVEDSGDYTCRIYDLLSGCETAPIRLAVSTEELPAANLTGLLALVAILVVLTEREFCQTRKP
ncbi:MAG: immunoglobulin domain-containing protein [Candidatus Staskawiczbacteria bacterium]|nr:immunoglobulin domain-containing protein [Candidatus Staskawiczbacteria bacterium]